MRYFLEIAYNGSPFHGWQSQPNALSVQAVIEDALTKLLQKSVAITGAGRTDTGVNARQTFAHFDSQKPIEDSKKFLLSLNCLVGKDIYIKSVFHVDESAHARFDASEREYKYFVSFEKNPFLHHLFWKSPSHFDFSLMNEAAQILLQTEDFTSFAKLHSDSKTNICKVIKAIWLPIEKDEESLNFLGNLNDGWVFTIKADRFLRNMVRSIVGTLVDVGRKKLSIQDFIQIINEKNRCKAGVSMPPYPLFLWRVSYPFPLG